MLGAACFWHPRARAIDTGIEGSACNYRVSKGMRGWDGGRADQRLPVEDFGWAFDENFSQSKGATAYGGKYTAGGTAGAPTTAVRLRILGL